MSTTSRRLPFLLFTVVVGVGRLATGSELEPMERFLEAQELYDTRQVLGYGERCSWEEEAIRIETQLKLHSLATTMSSMETFNVMTYEQKKLTTQTFCKEDLNLQCKKATGSCGCDDSTWETRARINFTSKYENGECRSPLGSTCLSFETDESTDEALCTDGTKCQIRTSKVACTEDNFAEELVKQGLVPAPESERNAPDIYRVTIKALSQGLCQCI